MSVSYAPSRTFVLGGLPILLGLLTSVTFSTYAARPTNRLGRADHLVSEALGHELAGLTERRAALLAQAITLAPNHSAANWHSGHVYRGTRWVAPEDDIETPGEIRHREAYEKRREGTPDTLAGHVTLANWCREHRLPLREIAHLNAVIQRDPNHSEARVRLGHRRIGERWIENGDLWRKIRNAGEVQQSVLRWRPELDSLLACREKGRTNEWRVQRQRFLDRLTPDAVPAIELLLGFHSEESARLAVEFLAFLPTHESSHALMRMALFSPWPTIKTEAAENLRERPLNHYVPTLLAELSTPITSRVDTTLIHGFVYSHIYYRHSFARDTYQQTHVRALDTEMLPPGYMPGIDRATLLTLAAREMKASVEEAERQRLLQNVWIHAINDRICKTLQIATAQDLPPSPGHWWDWWNEENGITVGAEKSPDVGYGYMAYVECFAAGTPVWTIKGPVDIERLRRGDLVLSKHPETGELAYKPILQTTIRPAERLIRVTLCTRDREPLEGSGGHPVWVDGKGWTLLREIQSGDILHGISRPVVVSEVQDGRIQQTFNLVVADSHSYVVGHAQVLCHDNTPRRPTNALIPGLILR